MFDDPDPCSWLIVLGVGYALGSTIVERSPKTKEWGQRLGLGFFLAAVLFDIFQRHPEGSGEWLALIVRSGISGLLVMFAAWCVLPSVVYLRRKLFSEPALRTRAWIARRRRRQSDREAAERQRREHETWRRAAPEREATRRAEEAAQKRRADARARLEFLYHRHGPEVQARFPRPLFDEFLQKHLSDHQSPEDVDSRARQLEELLLSHVAHVTPKPQFGSLADLAAWFGDQKTQIDAMPDGRLKSSLLARLNARYAELTQEHLEGQSE